MENNIEMQDLQNQLKEILTKKDKSIDRLSSLRTEFDVVSSSIKKQIAEINELKLAENRLLQKIHNQESYEINKAVNKSITNENFFTRFLNLFKKPNQINTSVPLVSYSEVAKNIVENQTKNTEDNLPKENVIAKESIEAVHKDAPKETKIISSKNKTNVAKKKPTQKTKQPISKESTKSKDKKEVASLVNTDKDVTALEKKDVKIQTESNIDIKNNDHTTSINILSIEESDILDPPSTKQEGLSLWIKHEGITYDESKLIDLYNNYSNFLEKKFSDKISKDSIYSQKGPSFKLALRKALEINLSK